MSNTTTPTEIRPTKLDTNPPVVQVQGGKDALKAAFKSGRANEIEGVQDWQKVLRRNFGEVLSDLLKLKQTAQASQAAPVQADEAPVTARPQENSGVSIENNLKPSWVAKQQSQNQDNGRGI